MPCVKRLEGFLVPRCHAGRKENDALRCLHAKPHSPACRGRGRGGDKLPRHEAGRYYKSCCRSLQSWAYAQPTGQSPPLTVLLARRQPSLLRSSRLAGPSWAKKLSSFAAIENYRLIYCDICNGGALRLKGRGLAFRGVGTACAN